MTDETEELPPIGLTGSGSWYPDDFTTVEFDFLVGTGGVEVLALKAWRRDRSPMTPKLQRRIGAEHQKNAELWVAAAWTDYKRRRPLGAGTLYLGEGDDRVAVQLRNAVLTGPPDHRLMGSVVDESAARRRRRGSLSNQELLEKAAAAFLGAEHGGRLAAVEAALQVSKPQASRYVRAAREAGFIPDEQEN